MEELVVRPKPARMGAAGGRLCINSGSHAISKSPPPAAPKIRIIHLFAPEIIQTDAANFRDLVQRLTGKQAIANAEAERRHVRSKKKNARPVPTQLQQQKTEPEAPAVEAAAGVALVRQESSSGGGETSDSGGYGSEGGGVAGPFAPEVEVQVKKEHEVLDDMWFGGSYAGCGGGGGGGGSSCSGASDVGTDSAEFGFVDLDEFVQGLYEYPDDASMGCSTVYADLFGESPVSGC